MRKLFSDIHTLAQAVERNDPALEDFNYFVGLSSMVTPRFEKLGFKVAHHKEQLGLPALGQPNQADVRLEMRPVMAALINKQGLVERMQIFARLGR